MIKLSHSRKGTRIIFVALLVMALAISYALPMAVYADDNSGLPLDNGTDILIQDDLDNENSIDENSGEIDLKDGEEDPPLPENEDDSAIDPVDKPTLVDPVDEPTFLDTSLNILEEEAEAETGPIKLEMNGNITYYHDLDSAVAAFKTEGAAEGVITFVEYTEPEPVFTLLSSNFPSSSILIDGQDLTIDGGGLNP